MKKNHSTYRSSCNPFSCRIKFFISLLFHFPIWTVLLGQQSNLPCNAFAPWIPPTFTVAVDFDSPGLACWEGDLLCPGSNVPANVVNTNTADFATGSITGVGSLVLSVTDNTNDYSAGDFAGFVVSSGLFSLGFFNSITLTTYLNNVEQEDYQAVDLIGLSASFLSSPIPIGFVTTMPFDEVEITIDNLLGLGTYNVHYAILEKFCPGDTLQCNVQTPMNKPDFPVTIDYSLTGSSGVSVAVVDDPEDAISSSTTDYASLIHVASLLGSSFLTVEEQIIDYPAGTFVGFDIENLTLLGAGLLNYITITSYLNDVQQEIISGPGLLAGVPLLNGSGRHTVGFVTSTSADKVRITIQQPAGITLGTTRVYGAIFQKLCGGDPPACNAHTVLTQPDYPVWIDMAHTGLTGAACGGCSVIESGNVIDDNSASYAQIIITAGVLTTGSLAVKDQLTDYPSGTFAGFRIENANLVEANALTGITISTYLNGSFQESETNLGALLTIGSDLLANDDQQLVGFITGMPFDEVKISLQNVGAFDIGTTRIHELIIHAFCPTLIECDTTYFLNEPEFPVYIDAFRTGVDGVACVACSIVGEENVITASNSDYALITVVANVIGSASIAVADALYTYPPGTYAGFVIEDLGLLLEAELFESLTISTYNNGVFQESKSGGDLIDLALIILFISNEPGRYNVGFETTLPFDEIRITVGSIATVINLVRVYSAFVDTRGSVGGDLLCNNGPIATIDLVTTNEDTPINIQVLENDSDEDDPLGVPIVTDGPAHGMVTVNPDSTITYTPAPDFNGLDTFIYIICDPEPLCDTAIVIIDVLPLNDPPLASPDPTTTNEDTPVIIDVLDNDTDVDNPLGTPVVTDGPEHGMVTVNADSTITYTPDPDFVGLDTFIYTLCDPQPLCDTAIVIVNVLPINDPPVAQPDATTTDEDTPVVIDVLDNDSDVDNPLGVPVVTDGPEHGMVTVNPDSTITYTPDPEYVGLDTFIYTLCDPQPLCDTAFVIITVFPTIDTLTYMIPEDDTLQVCSDSLTIFNQPVTTLALCDFPTHGTATITLDCVTFDPDPDFTGPDTFCVYVCHPDIPLLCDTTIIIVIVTPVNDPPVAEPDSATTYEDTPVIIDVLNNDSDVDNPLGIPQVTDGPTNGMVAVNPDSTITYTPDPAFIGLDTFVYAICDPQPLCDTTIVIVNVILLPDVTINCASNLVMECGSANYPAQINAWINTTTASSSCPGIVTITTNYDGTSVPALSCNQSSGLTITFTATDQCGSTATCIRMVYLDDSLAPTVTPGALQPCYNTVEDALEAAIIATSISDNCTAEEELIVSVELDPGPNCDSLITVTVTDGCGNSGTATYEVMINCQIVRLKVLLEGPYSITGDSMRTTMNTAHTLPGQLNSDVFIYDAPAGQPYQPAPWNYAGNLGLNFGDGIGMTPYPSGVVDWILVSVRKNGIMPAQTVWTCAGWVHRDGTVTFPETCPGPAINIADDYYFLVQHQNHLGILSPSFVNILCDGAVLEWDFTSSDSYKPVFRVGQKQIEPGVWVMYDGNGEQILGIGSINSADRTNWKVWQGFAGYNPGDFDLDVFTNSVDETEWKVNQNRTSGVTFY